MSEPVKDLEEVGLVIKGQPGEAPLLSSTTQSSRSISAACCLRPS